MSRLAVLLVLFFALSCFIPRHGLEIYLRDGGVTWETAQVEKMEVVFYDGAGFVATSNHADFVALTFGKLKRLVEGPFRRCISDIATVTHNHPHQPFITVRDREFLLALRDNGFHGSFRIWHQGAIREY